MLISGGNSSQRYTTLQINYFNLTLHVSNFSQQEDDASDPGANTGDLADREPNSDSNSEENSGDESGDEKPAEKAVSTVDEEEEEAEWERFQKKINKYVVSIRFKC